MGALVIWLGWNFEDQPVLSTLTTYVEEAEQAGLILIITGSVMIASAILGFLGGCFRNKICLTIFAILCFILGINLISIGAVMIYSRTIIDEYLGD